MQDINLKAEHPQPELCGAPTEFLDYDHPSIQDWLRIHLDDDSRHLIRDSQITDTDSQPDSDQARKLAVKLYYLVRDGWRYNPYTVYLEREKSRASYVLQQKQSYCIPKALLLATFARAVGIPARLGFGDVKNHLSSQRLIDYLRSDVFAFHGFAELYLEGQWVRATPAFDARLCAKFHVEPLEFDGVNDSLFQEYDKNGRRFMDYIRYHGVFADLPWDYIFDSLREIYPHIFEQGMIDGDLLQEASQAAPVKGHAADAD
ncbi:MAG: transglutaminase domain-containing protein [Leptospiraceae bacterium]|nr:transglutaminase domain-containing protein [Leptospiraceae bacterium]